MKHVIFAIAAVAALSISASANATYYHDECDGQCRPTSPAPVVERVDTIDPWLLIKNRVLAKELPTAKVKRLCVGKNPDDFHKDIGGITLDPHHWTPLDCVRARFERIEAMMEK